MDNSKVVFDSDTPRERYLNIARLGDKLSRKKSWIYRKLLNDPSFPRPLRLGTFPVFAESQIDAWAKAITLISRPPNPPHGAAKIAAARARAAKRAAKAKVAA